LYGQLSSGREHFKEDRGYLLFENISLNLNNDDLYRFSVRYREIIRILDEKEMR
jgi:hypothetical protein